MRATDTSRRVNEGRKQSDQEYADHVQDDLSTSLFYCLCWWEKTDEGEQFWRAIEQVLEDAELDVICKGDLQ